MKHGAHHLFTVVILAVFFLLFATLGYGAYSDSLTAIGSFSVAVPTKTSQPDADLAEGQIPDVPDTTEDIMPQSTPAVDVQPEATLSQDVPAATDGPPLEPTPTIIDDTPGETVQTPVVSIITTDPEASVSKCYYKNNEAFTRNGKAAPYFSGAYVDRAGMPAQTDIKPVCHWEKKTLVAYVNVFVPQAGTPGTAILKEMKLAMGVAIRFENTTEAELVLTRISATGGVEGSFSNTSIGSISDNSMRLTSGECGVVSAYLEGGSQLGGQELDLENLSGMTCTREMKMVFQVDNQKTGESRTFAILLVITVKTQAPVPTPEPTIELLPIPTEIVPETPVPSPVPEVETSPAPSAAPSETPAAATGEPEANEPAPPVTPAPLDTPAPTPNSFSTPEAASTPEAVTTPEAASVPETAPTPEAIPEPESTSAAIVDIVPDASIANDSPETPAIPAPEQQ